MSKRRSDSIAVYNYKGTNYCRLCTSVVAYNMSSRLDICRRLYSHTCCSYGDVSYRWTKNFHFDNTKHIIVLSTNFCSLCNDRKQDCFSSCRFKVSELMHGFADEMQKVEET